MRRLEKFNHWKSYAERDLDAAQAMFETGRWFYVLFMCQQAVEKLIKGVYSLYLEDDVPRTHNIEMLANQIEDNSNIFFNENIYLLFRLLSKYYLTNRYPNFINETAALADKHEVENIYQKTKEVFAWLLTLKPLEY